MKTKTLYDQICICIRCLNVLVHGNKKVIDPQELRKTPGRDPYQNAHSPKRSLCRGRRRWGSRWPLARSGGAAARRHGWCRHLLVADARLRGPALARPVFHRRNQNLKLWDLHFQGVPKSASIVTPVFTSVVTVEPKLYKTPLCPGAQGETRLINKSYIKHEITFVKTALI